MLAAGITQSLWDICSEKKAQLLSLSGGRDVVQKCSAHLAAVESFGSIPGPRAQIEKSGNGLGLIHQSYSAAGFWSHQKGCLWRASRTQGGSTCRAVPSLGPRRDSGQHHVDLTSVCKGLWPKAVLCRASYQRHSCL